MTSVKTSLTHYQDLRFYQDYHTFYILQLATFCFENNWLQNYVCVLCIILVIEGICQWKYKTMWHLTNDRHENSQLRHLELNGMKIRAELVSAQCSQREVHQLTNSLMPSQSHQLEHGATLAQLGPKLPRLLNELLSSIKIWRRIQSWKVVAEHSYLSKLKFVTDYV